MCITLHQLSADSMKLGVPAHLYSDHGKVICQQGRRQDFGNSEGANVWGVRLKPQSHIYLFLAYPGQMENTESPRSYIQIHTVLRWSL